MVEVFSKDLMDDGRRSSKGNQLKWRSDGIWYKADYCGYEGLSEYVISRLLGLSSLDAEEYVSYETESIQYHKQQFLGCRSREFSGNYKTITLERLFMSMYGESLCKNIFHIKEPVERLKYLVEQVERVTGLRNFGIYMAKLLTIDALFLNEDRHTHNIALLVNDLDEYRLCPIYDNGADLLSDTTLDYPLGCDIYESCDRVQSKTFCEDFDEQLDCAEQLYGRSIVFSFGYNDLSEVLDKEPFYPKGVKKRVSDIVMERRRKYAYLFK